MAQNVTEPRQPPPSDRSKQIVTRRDILIPVTATGDVVQVAAVPIIIAYLGLNVGAEQPRLMAVLHRGANGALIELQLYLAAQSVGAPHSPV